MTNKITKENLIETLTHGINGFEKEFVDDEYTLYNNYQKKSLLIIFSKSIFSDEFLNLISIRIGYDCITKPDFKITHNDFDNEILPFLQRNIDIKPIPEESIEEWFSKLNSKFYLFNDRIGGIDCYCLNNPINLMIIPISWPNDRIKSAILKGIEIYESN